MPDPASPNFNPDFTETRWSVIARASGVPSAPAVEALNQLCRTYWFPVYAYVRKRGYSPHDAQDLTQEFFLRLIEKRAYASANRKAGRFRAFLITALKNFLTDEWRKATAAKRGGSASLLSLDQGDAEARYQSETATDLTPDAIFQRRWSLTILSGALDNLAKEHRKAGKERPFELLKPFLTGEGTGEEREAVAAALETTTTNVRMMVHRTRKRFRQLVRQEVLQTVTNPEDAEDEMRHLFAR